MKNTSKLVKFFCFLILLVTAVSVTFFVTVLSAWAQDSTTWRGPTANPPGDNVSGLIQNRGLTDPQDASINITGNLKVEAPTDLGQLVVYEICFGDPYGDQCRYAWDDIGGESLWVLGSNDDIYYKNGKVGIGTENPRTRLEIGNDGAILAIGNMYRGWTEPNIGNGTRMLWYPGKAAFRVGHVNGSQWNDINIGSFSFASGLDTTASGDYSTAMGIRTTASGESSTAMGHETTASGYFSTAMGYKTTASGLYSIAIGSGTTASGHGSIAMGNSINVTGSNSFGIGLDYTTPVTLTQSKTVAIMGGNVGIGTENPRTRLEIGNDGAVLATGILNSGWTESNIGAGTRMLWYPRKSAFRVGNVAGSQWDNINIGKYSFASGFNTTASGDSSTAMGSGTTANALRSTAMGSGTTASGFYSTAMGWGTTASFTYSTAMGFGTTASGSYSTAMGISTTASGSYSTAMGISTTASGSGSTAMGAGTTASGLYSTAIGSSINVTGAYSFGVGLDYNMPATLTQSKTMAIMGGSVGIGTANPAAKLDVAGNANAHFLTATGHSNSRLALGHGTDDIRYNGIWVLDNYYEEGEVADKFFRIFPQDNVNTAGDWPNYFVMNNVNGNVGIGTANPTTKLDVAGNIKGQFLSASGNLNSSLILGHGDDDLMSGKGVWRLDNYKITGGLNNIFRIFPQSDPATEQPAWQDYFMIKYINGYVGIGTANPLAKLHVIKYPNTTFAGLFQGDVAIVGNFTVSGNKNFVQDHPTDPTKQIVYTSLEGGESGTYTRGSGQLVNGEAIIDLPEHFGLVTSEQGLTVQVTPTSDTAGLYIANKSPKQIVVKEINSGKSNATFDFLVNGIRKGFENKPVIVDKFFNESDLNQILEQVKEIEAQPVQQEDNEIMQQKELGDETDGNAILQGQEIDNLQTVPKLKWWQKLNNFFENLF